MTVSQYRQKDGESGPYNLHLGRELKSKKPVIGSGQNDQRRMRSDIDVPSVCFD